MVYEIAFPNVGIFIEHLPEVAVRIFGFPILFYGVFITMGVLAGIVYAVHEAKRTGQNPDVYYDFLLYALIFCIIGARLYYVAFSWDTYKDDPIKIFAIREGGLAIYGGIIAAVITAIVYTKWKKLSFGLFADTAAPALILGQAFGRWGNFFNREAFGTYTDSLLAMRLTLDSVRSVPQKVFDKAFSIDSVSYIQVHPTFLYESLWNLTIFILLNVYKKNKKFDGEIFFLYILGYGIGRMFIEGLRTDQLHIWGTGVAVSQVLSGVLVVIAAIIIGIKRRKVNIS